MKRNIAAILCLAAAIICGIMAVNGYLKEKNAGSSYDALRKAVVAESKGKILSGEQKATLTVSYASVSGKTGYSCAKPVYRKEIKLLQEKQKDGSGSENPIDFAELQKLCPDAYAWIRVPDTQIDYPIVQSPTDNTFYLNHNPMGEYEFAGAIFTEDYNSTDFTDPNTLIYGHNMNNGSMFRELHKFEDKAFFDEHPGFIIYTPDQVLHYEIFAAYTYDDRHILKEFDFSDKEVFRIYLRDILQQKSMGVNIRQDVKVSTDDRIVTLSTCNGINEQRYLVQGVLLSE